MPPSFDILNQVNIKVSLPLSLNSSDVKSPGWLLSNWLKDGLPESELDGKNVDAVLEITADRLVFNSSSSVQMAWLALNRFIFLAKAN